MRDTLFLPALLAALTLGSGLLGCSKGMSSGSTATTSYSVSGSVGGLSLMGADGVNNMSTMDYATYYVASAIETLGGSGQGENQAAAGGACSDGKFYRVLCTGWSTPPVSAYADVSCSSGGSGSFTVTGLPLGSDVSCFVKRSTDGSTFKPFATLTIPSTQMGGTTDAMTPSGNVALTVSIDSSGNVSTTVSSGAAAPTVSGSTTFSSKISAFYGISCDASTDATENARCKCMMYQNLSSLYNSEDACVSASAAGLTAPSDGFWDKVNIRVYSGTVGSSGLDTNGDGTADLTAGSAINAVTVWGATGCSCSGSTCTGCTSGLATAGGESLPTFGSAITWTSGGTLAWSSSDITISATGGHGGGALTIPLTSNPVPASTASRATWLAWLVALVQNSNWDCNMGGSVKTGAAAAADGFCVGNYVWQVMEQAGNSSVLPRVNYRHQCTNWSSCTVTPSATYMNVEGIEFDSSGNVVAGHSMNPSPKSRYVLEQFIPNAAGGGGFKNKHEDIRWVSCLSGSGTDSSSGVYSCPGSANGIECSMRNEMSIKMIPSGTTGNYTTGFSKVNTVYKGVIRGGTNDGSSVVSSFDAFTKCVSAFSSSGGTFIAKFTKIAN